MKEGGDVRTVFIGGSYNCGPFIERSDVISHGCIFIQKQLMNVVWLVETLVNAGHYISK